MNDTNCYVYRTTKKSLLVLFVGFLLMGTIISSIVTFGASLVTFGLLRDLIPVESIAYFAVTLWLIFFLAFLFDRFHNRLIFLALDDEELQAKNIGQKSVRVKRNEISSSDYDEKDRLILNNTILINSKGLTQKKRIELGLFVPEWLPEHTLPDDQKNFLSWKRQLREQWQEGTSFSTTAQTNKAKLSLIRKFSLVALSIFVGLLIWTIISRTFQDSLVAIVPIGVLVFFLFLTILEFTTYKKFQVDEKGIAYQYGRKQTFFAWHDIKVIAFRIAGQRLLIWQESNRYKSYSYSHINSEEMENVARTIFEQATIRSIPVARV